MRQPTCESLSVSVRTVSDVMQRGKLKAVFSQCENYRYTLSRRWDPTRPIVAFIGLNPSTADKTTNDPTVTRCIGYALRWGMGGYGMLNAYAFRATKPTNMKVGRRFDDSPIVTDDPVGPLNDKAIHRVSRVALNSGGIVIAAWGIIATLLEPTQFCHLCPAMFIALVSIAAVLPNILCISRVMQRSICINVHRLPEFGVTIMNLLDLTHYQASLLVIATGIANAMAITAIMLEWFPSLRRRH